MLKYTVGTFSLLKGWGFWLYSSIITKPCGFHVLGSRRRYWRTEAGRQGGNTGLTAGNGRAPTPLGASGRTSGRLLTNVAHYAGGTGTFLPPSASSPTACPRARRARGGGAGWRHERASPPVSFLNQQTQVPLKCWYFHFPNVVRCPISRSLGNTVEAFFLNFYLI